MTPNPVTERPASGLDNGTIDAALLRKLTCFDHVTGLPNRALFREQLGLVLRMNSRNGTLGAVILVDIDDFRRIKNSLGHTSGDAFLKAVAARMSGCLRESDVLASSAPVERSMSIGRLDGTDFAVVLGGLSEPHDALRVTQRLRSSLAEGIQLAGAEVYPTLGMGVALFPAEGCDADALLECADIALGQAKEQGKGATQFYSTAMNRLASDRLALEGELRSAVAEGTFFPVYQPRIDASSGQVCGFEALVRWQHPRRGTLAPGAFIEATERSGLITGIGEFMLDAACRQNMAWQRSGLPRLAVSVNISAVQVARPDFVHVVARALESSGLPPTSLELEITESVLVGDAAGALQAFSAIKAMGVRIAIDDFGTGYSSLGYLLDFPFDVLKIDRSFVASLSGQGRAGALACAIIDLSRRLQIEVVAEGVETAAQRDFLISNGCRLQQGYLHARPLSAQALENSWKARLGVAASGP